MFAQTDWSSGDRPRVPSDYARGSEMLPTYPVLYNQNADLFDGLPPVPYYSREDVLRLRPTHGPTGRLFSPWRDRP